MKGEFSQIEVSIKDEETLAFTVKYVDDTERIYLIRIKKGESIPLDGIERTFLSRVKYDAYHSSSANHDLSFLT